MLRTALLVIVSLATKSYSDDFSIPFRDEAVCPFECCQFGEWVVKEAVKLRTNPEATADYVESLNSGDKVRAITGVSITHRPGRVEIVKPLERTVYEKVAQGEFSKIQRQFKVGEVLTSLRYEGEGTCVYWLDGRAVYLDIYCLRNGVLPEPVEYKVISDFDATWWIQIRSKGGKIGWTDQSDYFDGKDACGGS